MLPRRLGLMGGGVSYCETQMGSPTSAAPRHTWKQLSPVKPGFNHR